jgi:hypothetical protein
MKNYFLPTLFLLLSITAKGQTADFVKNDGITSPLHQANVGRITFMAAFIPIEQYKASDFLNSFQIK